MFLDDIGKALKFLAECFVMIAEEPKLLLPSLLSVVFGFFMSMIVIVPFVFMGLLGKIGYVMFGGFALVALFISFAFSYFFMGASSHAVYQHVKFGKSSLGEAFNRALGSIVTLLLLAATAAVVQMIVNMLKSQGGRSRGGMIVGFVASLAGDVMREGWDIAVRLLIPVTVIAGLGYMDTMRKSFDIVRNNFVIVGAGEVAIRVLNGVIGFFGVMLSVLIALGVFFLTTPVLGLTIALGLAIPVAFVLISLVSTLNLFIRTSYYTLVYLWAEERTMHGQEGPVAAPAPIQHAFNI
ncbi:MAG: hypothetical protein A4E28_02895 [Methanocella sp. PtaU1.Bin125]|nr:MAG: hypothetical protein A4E28_02895 [Methanocella sp. PtaU1.Bin125]